MNFISSHPAFNDTIDSLKNEFKDDKSNSVIICGAHDFSRTQSIDLYKKKYDKVIVFNQEPLTATQRQFMHKGYFAWLKQADEVWDYDEQNIEVLKLIRPDVKLHILKPYKDWSVYQPVAKDIDILFYGGLNEHRKKLLNHLSKKYKVVIFTYGSNQNWNDLDRYILRSKILLNIHFFDESKMQEQARMIKWIGAPCRIISEKSWKNYLGVEEYDYKDLFNI
jgi:hypothetical protein